MIIHAKWKIGYGKWNEMRWNEMNEMYRYIYKWNGIEWNEITFNGSSSNRNCPSMNITTQVDFLAKTPKLQNAPCKALGPTKRAVPIVAKATWFRMILDIGCNLPWNTILDNRFEEATWSLICSQFMNPEWLWSNALGIGGDPKFIGIPRFIASPTCAAWEQNPRWAD